MVKTKVLVVDDDPVTCEIVSSILSNGGYEVIAGLSGRAGLKLLYEEKPDLVLLDLMMPEIDGIESIKRIRELTDIPVVMLTAMAQTDISVRALELGADDFITKPFEKEVLLARVQTILRRSGLRRSAGPGSNYQDDHLVIDQTGRRIFVDGSPVRLTFTEYKLLEYLYARRGRLCTYSQILEEVWGDHATSRLHYLYVYLSRLRKKIERDPEHPEYLLTEQGVGYRFQVKASQ